jgi:hypothetical protein
MSFEVIFHEAFVPEFDQLSARVQDELLVRTGVLEQFGPSLGRPHVDTLKGSAYPNMKELRFQLDGVWRFAFAWDPMRQAVILCGGDKEGTNQKRFYKALIRLADARFADHIVQGGPDDKPRS